MKRPLLLPVLTVGLLLQARAWAGPPYVTDDPEPVDLHHWEVYISSQRFTDSSGTVGTLPHVEINNGTLPNLQLHIIVPYAYAQPSGSGLFAGNVFGIGDVELGAKYRFVQETKDRPMVGVFPLLEVPAGNAERGLGSGHLQAFLPVWIQKSWGSWTTYGGGGYFINPGTGSKNYGLLGWLLQKDLSPKLTLGNEFYYTTPSVVGGTNNLNFNFGGQYNFDDGHHFLFSAGRGITGDVKFQSYVGYQWTFGPRESKESGSAAPAEPHAAPHAGAG